MRKILFYVPSVIYGGGESYIYNLITQTQQSHKARILVLTGCKKLAQLLKFIECEVRVINTSPSLSLKAFWGIIILNLEVTKFKPDILFLNGLPEAGSLGRYIIGKKFQRVTICHSNEYWIKEKMTSSIKRFLRGVISYNSPKFIDKMIVITEDAYNSLTTLKLFNCKINKIYNGIQPININKNICNKNNIIFGRISRLCEGKGNELLIKAFSSYIKSGYQGKLIIAGEGEELNNLMSLASDLNINKHIDFIGHVAPKVFFSKIDCMISPSFMEALPTVISEAMSCKIPVISTSVGGVSEMITHKYSGYLIPPNSENALNEALKIFSLDPNVFNNYAENAYLVYKDKFSIKASAKKTWEYIDE